MAANDGEHPVPWIIPGIPAPQGTGAPGTDGIGPGESAAPLMSGVIVSVPGQSSQVAPDRADVSLGDTCATSNDSPVPAAGDPMTGLRPAALLATGAGQGGVYGPPHHNNPHGEGPQL